MSCVRVARYVMGFAIAIANVDCGSAAVETDPGAETDPGSGGAVPAPPALPAPGRTITTVQIRASRGEVARTAVPATFALPLSPGLVPSGYTLAAKSGDVVVPLQVDAKAKHPDGSMRHAILSTILPSLPAGATLSLDLFTTPTPSVRGAPVTAAQVLATSFEATVAAGSVRGSVRAALALGTAPTWLSGPLVTEWSLALPLKDANGSVDPRLVAHFDVRAYAGVRTVAVSVNVDNDWAFEVGPRNAVYDAVVATDRGPIWSKAGLVHTTQARWRKSFVWGEDPRVDILFDPKYLTGTGAVPNYDTDITPAETTIASYASQIAGPMEAGAVERYMPATGGRRDIGLLPSWSVVWLLAQDRRARDLVLNVGDLSGSWPIHYVDKASGLPVSLDLHPKMTLLAGGQEGVESFPSCGADCSTPFTPDSAHQPSLAYLPFLITGDRYYLDELQHWANWNMLQANPAYRDGSRGLLKWDQLRGQAWSLRTLAEAAYITPDDHPLKDYFVTRTKNNLEWYTESYVTTKTASPLGPVTAGYAIEGKGQVAAWMDDFFTSTVGHVVELGFLAKPLLQWKARFPIGRMSEPYCWLFSTTYRTVVVNPTTGAALSSWSDVYAATLEHEGFGAAASLACDGPEMVAYLKGKGATSGARSEVLFARDTEGYAANLQAALAVAVDSDAPGASAAWARFAARDKKPDYSSEPQFAIVPRRQATKPP